MAIFSVSALLLTAGTAAAQGSSSLTILPRNSSSALSEIAGSSTNCTEYSVRSTDTCFTISSVSDVTWAQILTWNPNLNPACSNLQDLETVCISNPNGNFSMPTNTAGAVEIVTTTAAVPSPTVSGSNSDCGRWYLHDGDGDNCDYITESFSISMSDFLFLNSEVWSNCTNLWAGYYYCIKPVGDISSYPGYSTAEPDDFIQTPTHSIPYVDVLAKYKSFDPIIPIANDTRTDCYWYIWFDNTTDNSATDCWMISWIYSLTKEELVLWNPSLAEGFNSSSDQASAVATSEAAPASTGDPYTYPCTTTSTLVTPTPTAAQQTPNCTWWQQATSYSTCDSFLSSYILDMETFYEWNPTVKADCSGLAVGTYYCVETVTTSGWTEDIDDDDDSGDDGNTTNSTTVSTGTRVTTPAPVQTGMTSDCSLFYDVVQGDTCYDIAASNDITLDIFYAWNPAVGTDCSDLEAGVYVCIGVTSSMTTTTSVPSPSTTTAASATATVTTTAMATPTPIQSGMVSDCQDFYYVQSGDGCWAIANAFGIDLNDFYDWNPAVNTDCSGLQANVYVCVGV